MIVEWRLSEILLTKVDMIVSRIVLSVADGLDNNLQLHLSHDRNKNSLFVIEESHLLLGTSVAPEH